MLPRSGEKQSNSTRELLLRATRSLGGESARLDAELLLSAVLDRPRTWLYAYPEAGVADADCTALDALLARRRAGEPVAYLCGHREFWSLDLFVSPATLIPRPETELLVELTLDRLRVANADVLDLGTGCGAIALALASERPAWGLLSIDCDSAALDVARANAESHGLDNVGFLMSDWYGALRGQRFAAIVSNPPYVREDDPCLADLEFEPRHALVSGADGLDALRIVTAGASKHLLPGGYLLCEHGMEQGEAARELFLRAGFEGVVTRLDLQSRERVTLGHRATLDVGASR